ncbi:TPA: DUF3225 domain-containing protein [Yersinia enterocolitica]|nr:DUF3225 domain-containing protein [Yersinia enterocolitica]HDL6508826.1 DUF3225 domain-containing protein [Yersinia enterocolitica]HDL6787274.1 DUF3225 domain-containing protein [Yersinia enterocolitica]HDL7600638.1 DUF3225 domain-containing protein [Yersinia enterocolitica]HDL7604778.1 DUF3225 domain-containing protein [Yersinia enterocolitica]
MELLPDFSEVKLPCGWRIVAAHVSLISE